MKAQQFFFCQPYRDFFFPSFPTTPSLEKPKLMFEAALMCLNSHGPDTCNKKKLLKSETLDFVNMDVCPRYQVLTLGEKKKTVQTDGRKVNSSSLEGDLQHKWSKEASGQFVYPHHMCLFEVFRKTY